MNISTARTTNTVGEPTSRPQPKVVASAAGSAVGAAATTVGVYIFETATAIDLPVAVEGAVLVLVTAAVGFLAGYIKRPNPNAS